MCQINVSTTTIHLFVFFVQKKIGFEMPENKANST